MHTCMWGILEQGNWLTHYFMQLYNRMQSDVSYDEHYA